MEKILKCNNINIEVLKAEVGGAEINAQTFSVIAEQLFWDLLLNENNDEVIIRYKGRVFKLEDSLKKDKEK